MPAQIFISLSEAERVDLDKAAVSRMTPVRLVARAQAIRMAAANTPSYQIAEHLGVEINTIGRWRKRYAESRIAGIVKDRPRAGNHGGKKTVDQETLRQQIIKHTTQDKPVGSTHWSTRIMAQAMGTTPLLRELGLAGGGPEAASVETLQSEQ